MRWVLRSTQPRARAIREFLNHNISVLPEDHRAQFRHNLIARWSSAFFELLVARVIQTLGGAFEVEAENSEGRRADFHAVIQGQPIVIEAVAPEFDREITRQMRFDQDLLSALEPHVPDGWGLLVSSLPAVGPNDSKAGFRRYLERLTEFSAPDTAVDTQEVRVQTPWGVLKGTLIRGNFRQSRVVGGPGYSAWDDSSARIVKALRKKRRQTRAESRPVIIAVHASGMSTSFENFDRALFGDTVSHVDIHGYETHVSFAATGTLASKPLARSFAGVLAFIGATPFGTKGPVLYLHPECPELGDAFRPIERRTLSDDRIAVVNGTDAQPLRDLKFAAL